METMHTEMESYEIERAARRVVRVAIAEKSSEFQIANLAHRALIQVGMNPERRERMVPAVLKSVEERI